MKKSLLVWVLALSLTLIYSIALAGENGNKLPPGPRYMLNVIAFDKDNCPAGDFTGSNRHMIAVQADFGVIDPVNGTTSTQAGKKYLTEFISTNTILLTPTPADLGNTFQVIDGNACSQDQGGAEFMLPLNPYLCGEEGTIENDPNCINEDLNFQEYKVYVRLVGKIGTKIGVTTCAVDDMGTTDKTDDIIICSTENVIRVRGSGKGSMQFSDVTKQLLTICLNTDDDPQCDIRYALFDPEFYNYFWQWNTFGKAHAQLVFWPIPD